MKYGKDKTKEICDFIKGGLGRVDACNLASISYETFSRWMEEKDEFSEAIKTAESGFKRFNLAIIQKASLRHWPAAAWLLERKFQDEFAMKQKLEHTGKPGAPVEIVAATRSKLKGMTPEELRKLAESK